MLSFAVDDPGYTPLITKWAVADFSGSGPSQVRGQFCHHSQLARPMLLSRQANECLWQLAQHECHEDCRGRGGSFCLEASAMSCSICEICGLKRRVSLSLPWQEWRGGIESFSKPHSGQGQKVLVASNDSGCHGHGLILIYPARIPLVDNSSLTCMSN